VIFENVRAILFDFDGTLVEPSIDFDHMREAVLAVARRYGVKARSFGSMPVLEIIDQVTSTLNETHEERAFIEEAQAAILEIELEAADQVSAYTGVPDMLAQLGTRGYGVGIVTRNCRAAVQRVMRRIPMHYDVLLTRDDVSHVKPDPRHLSAALDMLGVSGASSMMCGDHLMDITAGRRVGAKTAGVLRPGVEPSYFDTVHPDVVLPNVTDLLQKVG